MFKKLKGSLVLLLTAIIWGSAMVAQTTGMDHVGPFTFNMARCILGFLSLLFAVCFLSYYRNKGVKRLTGILPNKTTLVSGIVCGLCLFLATNLQQYGLQTTEPGKAGFITSLYVVIVPFLGLLFKKKIRKILWICIPIAVIGLFLLCVNNEFSIGLGDLLIFACAFFYALQIIVVDFYLPKGADPIKMSCIQFLVVGILTSIPAFILESPTFSGLLEARNALLVAGIFSCGIAYTLQIIGQRNTDPALASMILSLESVFSVIVGWIVLNQMLNLKEIIGCALVFASVTLVQIVTSRQDAKKS